MRCKIDCARRDTYDTDLYNIPNMTLLGTPQFEECNVPKHTILADSKNTTMPSWTSKPENFLQTCPNWFLLSTLLSVHAI